MSDKVREGLACSGIHKNLLGLSYTRNLVPLQAHFVLEKSGV